MQHCNNSNSSDTWSAGGSLQWTVWMTFVVCLSMSLICLNLVCEILFFLCFALSKRFFTTRSLFTTLFYPPKIYYCTYIYLKSRFAELRCMCSAQRDGAVTIFIKLLHKVKHKTAWKTLNIIIVCLFFLWLWPQF